MDRTNADQFRANLKDWLERAERLWSEQLLAFKAHIESEG